MAAVVAGAVIWTLVVLPRYQARDVTVSKTSEKSADQIKAELINEYRKTLVQVIGGIFVAIGAVSGAYFTLRQITLMREGQITDRFTKAITQLGDEKSTGARPRVLPACLGGYFALSHRASACS